MWFKLLTLWSNLHVFLLAGSQINKTLELIRMKSQHSLYLASRQTGTGMAGLKCENSGFSAGGNSATNDKTKLLNMEKC